MDNLIETKKTTLIIVGLVVAVIFLAGLAAFVFKYFEVMNDMNRTFSSNPISHQINKQQQDQISEADLEKAYLADSGRIVNDFLAASAVQNADLAVLSDGARSQLLALTLPAKYKESHLAKVLLLSKITQDAQTGDAQAALKEISKLKDLAD
jgi:hypothetical protein